jgi:6-phosphogluconolactonase
MSSVEITVLETPEEAARLVAELLAAQAREGGSVVLTGGSTPRRAYELAAELEPDWSRVDLWWGDERCVPPDDERSNYLLAKEALLDRLGRAPAAVHRIKGELGAAAGAAEYDREIDDRGPWDLQLLGLGPDGHVASLFPGSPALEVEDRNAVGTEASLEPFVDRVTLTMPRIRGSNELVFLVDGEDKADAVKRVLADEPSLAAPGSLARAWSEGRTRAVLDRAAAAKL